MRKQAALVSEDTPGQRLPLPRADDELRRLGDTLNAMLARLESAIAHERRFVADASHELRTPLAILKSELELALRDGRTAEELRAAVASGSDETDRLVQLADDLLVLARSDRGALALRSQRVEVTDLLEAVARRFRLPENAVDSPDGLVLRGDRVHLEQALGNLVANALAHGAAPVLLSARMHGDRVELHVEDGGPGLPPEFAARAFERFSRADAARTSGGAGLGLAIVEAIAQAHGGGARIGRSDRGADVWIELPVLMDSSSRLATTGA
jgi:signal transduction histidine kinase